jgi:hypothetical protein
MRRREILEKRIKVSFVEVLFHGRGRTYTFKTIENLKPEDKVIVRTKDGLGTAEVHRPNVPEPKYKCNWVVGSFDLKSIAEKHFNKLKELGIKE